MSEQHGVSRSFQDYCALLVGQGGAVVCAAANTAIMARLLGSAGYAHVVVFVMVTQVIFTSIAGWLTTAIVRYGCEELVQQGSMRRTVGARVLIITPILALLVVGLLIWRAPLGRYLEAPSWIAGFVLVAILGSIALITVQSLLQARGMMSGYAWMLLIEKAGLLLGLGLVVWLHPGRRLLSCMALVACAPWISTLVGLRLLKQADWWPPVVEGAWVRRVVRFSSPFILGALAATITTWADIGLTNHFVQKTGLGVYGLARQIANLLKQGAGLGAILISPLLFKWFAAGNVEWIRRYVERLLPLNVLVWCSLVALVLPVVWMVLPLIWGSEFAQARWSWIVLVSEVGLCAWYYLGVPVLTAHEASVEITVINTLTAVLAPTLGWWWIPRYGIVGSAWAVFCASLAAQTLLLYYLRRYGRLSVLRAVGAVTPLAISATVCWRWGPAWALAATGIFLLVISRWLWRRRAFLEEKDVAFLRTIELPAWGQWMLEKVRWVLGRPLHSLP